MDVSKYELWMAAIWGTVIVLFILSISVPMAVYKIETEKYALGHGYVQDNIHGYWVKPKE